MAHNINENRMFCVGKAWHNIGIRVQEAVTAQQAIELAQLNYGLQLQDIYYNDGSEYKKIEGKKGVVRADNKNIIGVVGDRYTVVQNNKAFDFFDNVVEKGEAMYHSAGALGKGERIWILAKLPSHILVFDKDVIEKYLILTNSHDGTSALKMYFTPVRVVCQNTLNASLKNSKDGISIRHCGNINSKVSEARRVLGLALDFYNIFEEKVQIMARTKLTDMQINNYYDRLLKINDDEKISTRKHNIKDNLLSLQRNGKGNNIEKIRNTVWTTYNAVTEYTDYYRTVKGGEQNRFNSSIFGSGAKLKEIALNQALELIKI